MRRVLMVSPHFPPDSSAATHRVRLLLPHLRGLGWEPTVLTLTPESYEGALEPALLALVPAEARVERVAAWSPARTRTFGFGDLGLRGWRALRQRAQALLQDERFDALFWTVYPTWPAASGPALARAAGAAFVLDLQDPWVGAWGSSVGPTADGRADLRSRVSRALSLPVERRTVVASDGITAVSYGTIDALAARVPEVHGLPHAEVPLVALEADLAWARSAPPLPASLAFDTPHVHVVWVGTLLPAGRSVMRAILDGLALAVQRNPRVAERVRVHFVGTSNESRADAPALAMPIAQAAGVDGLVTEHASRVEYRAALQLLARADAVLLGGSTEAHYTPSRLYPALLSGAPLLAVYREGTHPVRVLQRVAADARTALITFGTAGPDAALTDALAQAWVALAERPLSATPRASISAARVTPLAIEAATALVDVLDRACAHAARRGAA